MKNKNIPSNTELPSTGKLIKSTIIAIVLATIILITVVLPAEYGIDPLGIGEMIGLTKMGEIKVSLAQDAAIEKTNNNSEQQIADAVLKNEVSEKEVDAGMETMTLTLEPNEGKEIKLTMAKGATISYIWYTDGGKANFDSHADSKKLKIKYHNYEKGQLERSEGVLEAAFDGNHGWFWRNRNSEVMTVTLKFSGDYTDVLQF